MLRRAEDRTCHPCGTAAILRSHESGTARGGIGRHPTRNGDRRREAMLSQDAARPTRKGELLLTIPQGRSTRDGSPHREGPRSLPWPDAPAADPRV